MRNSPISRPYRELTSFPLQYDQFAWWKDAVPNQITTFATDYYQMYDFSDLRVVKGDYLKLQYVSLSYRFSNEICRKLSCKGATANLSGSNPSHICSIKRFVVRILPRLAPLLISIFQSDRYMQSTSILVSKSTTMQSHTNQNMDPFALHIVCMYFILQKISGHLFTEQQFY